jgi:hypothetical protein
MHSLCMAISPSDPAADVARTPPTSLSEHHTDLLILEHGTDHLHRHVILHNRHLEDGKQRNSDDGKPPALALSRCHGGSEEHKPDQKCLPG